MRKNWPWFILVLTLLLFLVSVVYLRGRPVPGNQSGLVRNNQANAVEISVEFLNPKVQASDNSILSFQVALNTHSVSLTKFDLTKMMSLSTEAGIKSEGFTWEGGAESDHHRSGMIRVKNQTAGGQPLWTPDSSRLTLTFKDLAEPTRTFQWSAADWKR